MRMPNPLLSGRFSARFACLQPLLMSNVAHQRGELCLRLQPGAACRGGVVA